MFLKRFKRMGWIVGASVGVTLCSAGCRSGMSRANMFGFKSEPSAEMLAGDGPTMTYPAPPSESSTPQAIASVAAGTTGSNDGPITAPAAISESGTAQVAGLDIDPGYVKPATADNGAPNMAAAQANGIFNPKAPSYASTTNSGPSGYQYGSKSSGPHSRSLTPSPAPGIPSAYAEPATFTPPTSGLASATGASSGDSGGFTLPENVNPSIGSTTTTPSTPATSPHGALSSSAPVAADAPEHRIATSDMQSGIPAIDSTVPIDRGAPVSAPSTSAGGYSPGSTSGASGYPTGGYSKPGPTGGTYYR